VIRPSEIRPVEKRLTARPSPLAIVLVLALAVSVTLVPGSAARALTPESAEVRKLLKPAVDFLLKADTEPRLGGKAVGALALYKAKVKPSHPKIQGVVEEIKAHASEMAAKDPKIAYPATTIYAVSLEIILLAELDAQKYRSDIQKLMGYLLALQKPHGGWGYAATPAGDTSMTQYALLSLWEAARGGIESPVEVWERACLWLLRTQDPSGGFGYQARDPGSFVKQQQAQVRESMVVAGLGALFTCSDHLGLLLNSDSSDDGPSVLKRVEEEGEKRPRRRRLSNRIDLNLLGQALEAGDNWMQKNYNIEATPNPGHQHYYLYTLERYQSFKELVQRGRETYSWYDEGVQLLSQSQRPDGSWRGKDGFVCDTAFSVLFLVRSMSQTLGKGDFGSGTLVGGRGLDPSGQNPALGASAAKPLQGPAEKLLSLMEDPSHPDFLNAVAGFEEKVLVEDETTIGAQAMRMRKLAGSQRPEARLAVVRALGQSRDLDHVPTLIYALSDPDSRVVQSARDALRFVSRKFEGFGFEISQGEAAQAAAIKRWKDWFLSIRPDAEFED
jgi:hypothetical protein